MGSLAGKSPSSTYKSLLKVTDETDGVTGSDSQVEDGEGTATPMLLSTTKVGVKPSSNSTNSFDVTQSDGTNCLKVDTTNNRTTFGVGSAYVGTGEFCFSGSNIDPTGAGYHMAIPCGGTYLGGATDELDFGNGADPATSLDISGLTEDTDVIHYYWHHMNTINITNVDCFVGSESGTPTVNFHLFNYTLDKSNGGGSGDLSSGNQIAWTATQATSATAVNYLSTAVTGDNCNAGTVTVATIESTADVLLHAKVCVKYYIV